MLISIGRVGEADCWQDAVSEEAGGNKGVGVVKLHRAGPHWAEQPQQGAQGNSTGAQGLLGW